MVQYLPSFLEYSPPLSPFSLSYLKVMPRRIPRMPPLLALKPLHTLLRTYNISGSSITGFVPHRRPLGDTNDNKTIRFFSAQSEDEAHLARKLHVLLEESGGRWRMTEGGKGIERCFRFKTFDSAWVTGHYTHIPVTPNGDISTYIWLFSHF